MGGAVISSSHLGKVGPAGDSSGQGLNADRTILQRQKQQKYSELEQRQSRVQRGLAGSSLRLPELFSPSLSSTVTPLAACSASICLEAVDSVLTRGRTVPI